MLVRVFHGAVSVLAAVITNDGKWHQVISDPRKNMLLDIKNESQEEAGQAIKVEGSDIGDFAEHISILGIKEYHKYSEAEEQFLIPSEAPISMRNISTTIDPRKSFFTMNTSWKDSLDAIVRSVRANTCILVNGVMNSGKSTFTSCLIN